ncbi:hypothetical protein LTR53_012504 [Teratosphaeriaceae sp. CCFEE 6253]|nr:hypothetical protein LTR53_012504 [Teratosphaeriaceae sp. CCFEE 6253]
MALPKPIVTIAALPTHDGVPNIQDPDRFNGLAHELRAHIASFSLPDLSVSHTLTDFHAITAATKTTNAAYLAWSARTQALSHRDNTDVDTALADGFFTTYVHDVHILYERPDYRLTGPEGHWPGYVVYRAGVPSAEARATGRQRIRRMKLRMMGHCLADGVVMLGDVRAYLATFPALRAVEVVMQLEAEVWFRVDEELKEQVWEELSLWGRAEAKRAVVMVMECDGYRMSRTVRGREGEVVESAWAPFEYLGEVDCGSGRSVAMTMAKAAGFDV